MKNSVIISFFVSLFNKLVFAYNNSFIERIIDRICSFFKKSALNSFFIDFFINKFMNGSFWRNSLIFRVLMSPVFLLEKINNKIAKKVEIIQKESIFETFFSSLLDISLSQYGIILFPLILGYSFVELLARTYGIIDIIACLFGFALSLLLMLIKNNISNIFAGSFLANVIKKVVIYNYKEKDNLTVIRISKIYIFAIISFAIGLFMGITDAIIGLICFIAAIAIILILKKAILGVFLFVILAPILPTMALVALIGVTSVSFGISLATDKNMKYIITPFNMLIFAFLGLSILSSITSVDLASSIKICLVYIVFAMAYPLIVNTIRTRSSWYSMLSLFVICGALVSLYGIYQNFSGVNTTQSWVDAQMFEDIKIRVYSTFDNPNVLGQYFILIIPVAFAMLLKSKESSSKIIYTLINIAMFACLLYTWSRGAWVGVVLSLVFFLLLRDRRWLIICIIGLLLMPSVLPASILNRLTSIGNLNDSSTAYRVSVWVASLRIAKDYWMSGIGIGSEAFSQIYPNYALNGAGFALHSHNFYIQWVVEMGIFGLLTFLAIILTSYKQITLVKNRNSIFGVVALAMGGALVGILFQGMVENLWYNFRMVLMFWIYLGILQSGVNIANNEDR